MSVTIYNEHFWEVKLKRQKPRSDCYERFKFKKMRLEPKMDRFLLNALTSQFCVDSLNVSTHIQCWGWVTSEPLLSDTTQQKIFRQSQQDCRAELRRYVNIINLQISLKIEREQLIITLRGFPNQTSFTPWLPLVKWIGKLWIEPFVESRKFVLYWQPF